MDVITSDEMSVIDINCEYYGLSRLQLMENAGRGVAEEIKKRFEPCKVVIFAGLGNNGGDAFVAARHLKGYDVEILLMGTSDQIKTEIAKRNFEILKTCGYKIVEIRDSSMLKDVKADIIIDGMLGTGVKGKLRQPFLKAVEVINDSSAFVIAVDVPTGLDPDTGDYNVVVKADLTVTFHKAKPGLLKAKDIVGELIVKDIGIPKELEMLTGPGDVRKVYHRYENGHKGVHGKVLIIGGGPYTGAPALAAMASYYAGADIVTVLVPKQIYNIVASYSPNLIVRSVEKFTLKYLEDIKELIRKHHVVVIGMGAGRTDEFKEFVEELLKLNEVKKVVLDADALTSDIPENVKCILTPHRTEFKRLFGMDANLESVKNVAKKINSVILLKGKEDIITDGKRVKINKTGNAGMTVGGTGDVLAGIVGAFFALNDAFWSACAGAFVNGKAGDLCLNEFGYNFTAYDMLKKIPITIKSCITTFV
ncbi:MAG TPA: NAD(P)H-hydrate dehydratase [Archaeoglobus profundus]|nr:NAD(P)H-hydrate dehydratase [Archaeoglobus profundus]